MGLCMCKFGWDGSGGTQYSVMAWMLIITMSVYLMYSNTVYIPSSVIHAY